MRPRFPDRFSYYLADIRDADDQNLIRIFPECAGTLMLARAFLAHTALHRVHMFIDNALNAGGSVLVNCCDGISRSPALLSVRFLMSVWSS